MKSKITLTLFLSTIICLPALSYSGFLDQANQIYNKQMSCYLCHHGKKLNVYGLDFKKNLDKLENLIDTFRKIESLDSDKDKVDNLKEIKTGSLPGDKTNLPKKGLKSLSKP